MQKAIASILYVGYVPKGGGTVAALIAFISWWFLYDAIFYSTIALVITCIIVFVIGVIVSNNLEDEWGHDSSKIVIDEVLGRYVALLFFPHVISLGLLAFVLFRVFDIWKPLYIKRMEALKAGMGVMSDDLLAGVYSCLLVFAVSKLLL